MRRYCLSYDAKDSSKWKAGELREKIARLLIEKGAVNLNCHVASTILFEQDSEESAVGTWNGIFLKELKNDVYYYFCLVGRTKNDEFLDRIGGDKTLNSNFQKLISTF